MWFSEPWKLKAVLREGKFKKGYRFRMTRFLFYFFSISRGCERRLCWVVKNKGRQCLRLVVVPLHVLTQISGTLHSCIVWWGEAEEWAYGSLWSQQVSWDLCASLGTRIGIYRHFRAHAKPVWLLFRSEVGCKTIQSFFPLSTLIAEWWAGLGEKLVFIAWYQSCSRSY